MAHARGGQPLGVTPNTLRRWADRGQISSFTTPGGHRRFLATAVQALVPAGRVRRPALAVTSDRIARALHRARPLTHTRGEAEWMGQLSEADRMRFRQHGVRLVADLLTHLDSERGDLSVAERHAAVP